MNKQVKINKPANLRPDESFLYPHLGYEAEELKVSWISKAFVTKAGIVLKNFRIIKSSVHNYTYLYFSFYKIALGNFLLRRKKHLPGNEKYLVIHNIWSRGYYHWICEALPRLWRVKDEVAHLTLLLPESYKGFQCASLERFHFKEIIFFPGNANFIVRQLVLPSNPAKLYQPNPELCSAIRDYYHKQLDVTLLHRFNFGERIYISRKSAASRKIENEEALTEVLKKFDFRIVSFEEYSFTEQVAIMFHTRYLISIHGAGLTNMHFMQGGGSVLELYKRRVPIVDWGRGLKSDLPSPCYVNLASALQHKHYIQFCNAADETVPAGTANLIVKSEDFTQSIRSLLGL